VLFSNELLDAFPVRRFDWDAKAKSWFEWGVTLDCEKFAWSKIPNPQFAICNPQLEAVLPDGYIIEESPAAVGWWRTAAGILQHGKLLAIDYGYTAEEQFSPSRLKGTLRAYHRHQVGDDLLAQPGDQDLTAHVKFSAIQAAGEEAGLKTDTFCTQPQFLTRIFSRAVKEKAFASLDAKQIRQFQTLTHPEHHGRAFRVLVQGR
jgi:SAM-dependent MidA family methyltransferase